MSDSAFKTAAYPGMTTARLQEVIASGSGNAVMVAELDRRAKVAAGDRSVMTDGERLRASRAASIDTVEKRAAVRSRLQALREELASIAGEMDWIDQDAGRSINEARDHLHNAWTILRKPPMGA